ncbi:hypothetical protein C2845_PMPSC048695 [Panicum miliaceum]|uniref:Alcohol dehydrogenase-like N-terminal domain-containing protein n=1 Tax=Panicum miliaceum TaxID=4540 RepID=A0A3L6P9P7_PANMI|nr:hypothetical protein C2845_PMPSC048695 [Panicum miliaceum]
MVAEAGTMEESGATVHPRWKRPAWIRPEDVGAVESNCRRWIPPMEGQEEGSQRTTTPGSAICRRTLGGAAPGGDHGRPPRGHARRPSRRCAGGAPCRMTGNVRTAGTRVAEAKAKKWRRFVVRLLGDPTVAPGEEGSPFAAVSGDNPVRVAAVSLNFATFLQVQGKYQERPPLPLVPFSDYAGIVDAIRSGVRGLRHGDHVCSIVSLGAFTEFIVAKENQV